MHRRKRRPPLPPSPPDEPEPAPTDPAEWQAWHVRERERLARVVHAKVAAWAESWRDCPRKGCRRNRKCLAALACRAAAGEAMDDEQRARLNRMLADLLNRRKRSDLR